MRARHKAQAVDPVDHEPLESANIHTDSNAKCSQHIGRFRQALAAVGTSLAPKNQFPKREDMMEKHKTRRQFMKTAAVGAVAAPLAAPAYAQGKRTLKMTIGWPKKFPGLGISSQRLADSITTATDGRLTIQVFGAGELVPAFEAFDAVSLGAADMYHASEYYFQGKSVALNFFASVPYGLTTAEHNSWIYHGGGQELWDELSAGFGLKALMAGNTTAQAGGWFNKEINSLEDIKGLKMRIPGFGGKVIEAAGGTAVTLPGAEIFAALQSGTVDAAELASPWLDLGFGLYKAAKYYYNPGFQEPTSIQSLGINLSLWNDLSAADQQVIKMAAAQECAVNAADFILNNARSLNVLLNKHGVELRSFPDDVMLEFGKISKKVISEAIEADPQAAKVADSYLSFLEEAASWTEQSEQAFLRARAMVRAAG